MKPNREVTQQAKPICKVALVNLDGNAAGVFYGAFRQFGIQTANFTTDSYQGLGTQRFDGYVVRLSPGCEPILAGLRGSPRDRHVFIYGIAVPGQTIEQVSKFGINTLISEPVDRASVLKTVRATYLLVLHEFRRYVRIPFITDVVIKSGVERHRCASVELSGGGMSVRSESRLVRGESVECFFDLPGMEKLACNATICWTKPDSRMAGLRFDVADPRRQSIKKWIEEYLEL